MFELEGPLVAKFGGTSMAYPERVSDIVESRPDRRIIVVSAPGGTEDHPERMTLMLENMKWSPESQKLGPGRDAVIERFNSLYEGLINPTALGRLADEAVEQFEVVRSKDHLVSLGESLSASYLAVALGAVAVEPAIHFRGYRLSREFTRLGINQQLADEGLRGEQHIIVPGYYGFDAYNNRVVIGPGASDRTGAIYGAVTGFNYENWTDTNGIHSADPRKVPGAQPIKELTRLEVREGAHGGSGVFQGDSIIDLNGSSIIVRVRNTFNPDDPGTRIVTSREVDYSNPVVALSGKVISELSVHDLGMANEVGYLASLANKASSLDISIEQIPATQDYVSVVTAETPDSTAMRELEEYILKSAIGEAPEVTRTSKAIVYVVGEALKDKRTKTAVINEISSLLLHEGIYLEDGITSVKSSPSVTFGVDANELDSALQTVHDHFIG